MVSAISLGVFCLDAPSTNAIILSRKLSPGAVVTLTFILSDSTFVPPVTDDLSPPASLITGADSPVIALSSIVAIPSIISPSVGMISPVSQTKISSFTSCEEGTILISFTNISPSKNIFFAGVSSLVFLSDAACAFPRASASASAKLANSNVSKRMRKMIRL